jgi:LysM repeat protein
LTTQPRVSRYYLSSSLLILASLVGGCATSSKTSVEEPAYAPAPDTAQTVATSEAATAPAEPVVELRADAPETYVVQKGDTLWDISARFLKKPWYWPEIWHVNPDIRNPHLIYPGDVLSIYYVDGKPMLAVNGYGAGDYRLSPQIRTEALDSESDRFPIQALRAFLLRPQVVAEEELKNAAHIVDSQDKRLIYGTGDTLYARGLSDTSIGSRYSVFRPGRALTNPDNGKEVLGYEAIYASDAEVVRDGDPSTVVLEESVREVLRGDRLLPLEANPADMGFYPHEPPASTNGQIISLFDALSGIANYQVAVINLGKRNGIEPGHVLAVNQAGRVVNDAYHGKDQSRTVKLPDEQSGLMMVFRSFEKVSYGIIMESERPIRIGDLTVSP